jgi:hypothetical protein
LVEGQEGGEGRGEEGGEEGCVVLDVVFAAAPPSHFPGLYTPRLPADVWSPDGSTLTLQSTWRSEEAIVQVGYQPRCSKCVGY